MPVRQYLIYIALNGVPGSRRLFAPGRRLLSLEDLKRPSIIWRAEYASIFLIRMLPESSRRHMVVANSINKRNARRWRIGRI